MGREVLVDSKVGNHSSKNWSCLIGFIACVLHTLIWLVMRLFFKFFANGYPSLLCSKDLFSNFMQMGSHISSLFKIFFFQVLCKSVPMSSFLKIYVKLQVANPTHEQIKFVQSSIKSTQVWSSIKNSFFRTNPLPTFVEIMSFATKHYTIVCN